MTLVKNYLWVVLWVVGGQVADKANSLTGQVAGNEVKSSTTKSNRRILNCKIKSVSFVRRADHRSRRVELSCRRVGLSARRAALDFPAVPHHVVELHVLVDDRAVARVVVGELALGDAFTAPLAGVHGAAVRAAVAEVVDEGSQYLAARPVAVLELRMLHVVVRRLHAHKYYSGAKPTTTRARLVVKF